MQVNGPPAFQALFGYGSSLVSCVTAPLQVRTGEQIKWEGEKSKNYTQWINGGWEARWRGTLRGGGLDCCGGGGGQQTDWESR